MRTYDQENHVVNKQFNYTTTQAAYDWGPNGHPIRIGETSTSSTPNAGGAGHMAYETLHWDGNVLLFTTNGASKLDDIKIGAIGDITPQDPGYTGLTFWDRDPSGSFVYCHNATGAAGTGVPHVKTIYAVKTGTPIHTNPCYAYSGQTMTGIPSSIVWWSDGQSSQRIGWDGVLGMPRADGFTDGFNTIQGVRAFDASMGQWTAPDAYSGVVDDPMTQKSYVWNGNNPVAYSDPSGYDAYAPTTEVAMTDAPTTSGASEEPDGGQTTSGSGNAEHSDEPLKTIASVISCTNPALPPCGDWTKGEIQTVRNASSYIAALDMIDGAFVAGAFGGGMLGTSGRAALASVAAAPEGASVPYVIGRYPEYLKLAEAVPSKAFDLGSAWTGSAADEAANWAFIDEAISTGSPVWLSTSIENIPEGSYTAMEIQRLIDTGYGFTSNGWSLGP